MMGMRYENSKGNSSGSESCDRRESAQLVNDSYRNTANLAKKKSF